MPETADPDFLKFLLSADCAVILDQGGKISWCNDLAQTLLAAGHGATPVGKRLQECGLSLCQITGAVGEYQVGRVWKRVWKGQTISGLEVCVEGPRSGNEPMWFNVTAQPVFAAADDTVTGAMLVAHDITSSRAAVREDATPDRTHEALASLVQASPLPILALNLEDKVTYWNQAAEQVFGWTAEEAIGKPIPYLTPEVMPEHREMRRQDRIGSKLINREIRRRRKDGQPIVLNLSTGPIRDFDGVLTGTIGIFIDISERKKLEEQLWQAARVESLGVLAAGVAHDFNNLLTSILGNASLAIQDAKRNSDQQLALRNVIEACDRAALLTAQMLAYSGKARFHPDRLNVSALVRKMRELIESQLGEGVSAVFELGYDLPMVIADPLQMQQVVLNIVVNASEAMEGGAGRVAVRTRLENPEAGGRRPHVCLEVEDSGCGMDEDTRARMFDPFFSTKFAGRGLGLAAVIGIVRGHKGFIEVDSKPGHGTRCRVFLPAELEP